MAFCTSCGATVQGAFCQQCGTPSSAAAAPPAPAPQAPPVGCRPLPAPVKRKTSVLVWILLAVAGVFVLGIVGLIGVTAYYCGQESRGGDGQTDHCRPIPTWRC